MYPYLLGHSFFNVKDIPFLSVWLICTYLMISILKIFFIDKDIILKTYYIYLSIFTAYLLSIRISGNFDIYSIFNFVFLLLKLKEY